MNEEKIKIIQQTRNTLYQIHRSLLHYQSNVAAIKMERELSPHDIWHLSMEDQDFDWLKRIPSLIIVMDEILEASSDLPDEIFDPLVYELRSMFFAPLDKDISFYERVSEVREEDPSLLKNLSELMMLCETKLSSQIQI